LGWWSGPAWGPVFKPQYHTHKVEVSLVFIIVVLWGFCLFVCLFVFVFYFCSGWPIYQSVSVGHWRYPLLLSWGLSVLLCPVTFYEVGCTSIQCILVYNCYMFLMYFSIYHYEVIIFSSD
jgi:hypothetical protein